MYKSNYEVEVLVNGSSVKEYWNDGKLFIEGRKGAEFSLRIRNNGWRRVLAVPTIDGLSVMDGKEAGYNSSGYIINGYSSVVIDGWRTSDKDVAKFYFTNPEDSYSERKDRKNNLGVIGVAIFTEKYHEPIWNYTLTTSQNYPQNIITNYNLDCNTRGSSMMQSSQAMNCSMQSSAPQDLGTGFGGYKRSEVISVEFDKESNPDAVFEIYYNTREKLRDLGINLNDRPRYVSPQAFPNRYCEPPR